MDRSKRAARIDVCGFLFGFLAVLSAPAAPIEPDRDTGMTWSQVRHGGGFVSGAGTTGEILNDVVWGNGRFVAVGDAGTIVHSADGDRWQEASVVPTSKSFHGVVWGGGRFVAVGNSILYSSDGDRWETAVYSRDGHRWGSVANTRRTASWMSPGTVNASWALDGT